MQQKLYENVLTRPWPGMKHFIRPRPNQVDIQSGISRSMLKQRMPGLGPV